MLTLRCPHGYFASNLFTQRSRHCVACHFERDNRGDVKETHETQNEERSDDRDHDEPSGY